MEGVDLKLCEVLEPVTNMQQLEYQVLSYFILQASGRGIRLYLKASNTSSSLYVKPDMILGTVRISNHTSKWFKGKFSIICILEDINEAPKIIQDGDSITYYVNWFSYKEAVKDLIERLAFIKAEKSVDVHAYQAQMLGSVNSSLDYFYIGNKNKKRKKSHGE